MFVQRSVVFVGITVLCWSMIARGGENPEFELSLKSNKDKYTVVPDLDKEPKLDAVRKGAPAVDLVLEIKNNTKKDREFQIGGDCRDVLTFDLTGPGARKVMAPIGSKHTEECRAPTRTISVPAGKSVSVPIDRLSWNTGRDQYAQLWTKEGEYTVKAKLNQFESKPIKVKVVAK